MDRRMKRLAILAGMVVAGALAALAQPPSAQLPVSAEMPGGRLHGVVKSGAVPLPGVTVTAQNTLTGKRFSTTTDVTGVWSLNISQNGRYVLRTQFAAFAPAAQEAVLNAASREKTVSFDLILASRAAQQQASEAASQQAGQQAMAQLLANGTQSLSLMSALTSETETQAGSSGAAGAALPSIAGNSDFNSDSVAISGQAGAVSPLAGLDMDRVRDAVETLRAQGALPGGENGGGNFGGFGGGGFGGGGFGGAWRLWRRRARQLSRLQSRPAAWRDLLDRQQLGAQCGAVRLRGQVAAAAGFGHQSLRHHLHERAVSAAISPSPAARTRSS